MLSTDEPPDFLLVLAGRASVGAPAVTGAGTGAGSGITGAKVGIAAAGMPAGGPGWTGGYAGTGSVGERSALGFDGSKGEVMDGVSYS